MKTFDFIPMIRLFSFYLIILTCAAALSCRSNKNSVLSEESSIFLSTDLNKKDDLSHVNNNWWNSSISFDSIEIFIQRNWNPSLSNEEKNSNGDFMATPDSMRISSKAKPVTPFSEIIGIKAFNAKASSASASQDSLTSSSQSDLQQSILEDSQKEQTDSVASVAVFDPPDLLKSAIWISIIAVVILTVAYFIKRKLKL